MTNFGGDNPIGGSGGFGGGFGNQPPAPSGPPPFSGGGYPNAPGNAPFPGGGPAFGSPSFQPPSYRAPAKNRRKLFGIIAGAVVVVVAVVVGIVVFVGDSGSDATTASGAVKGYLKALAKGDAEKALSFGINEPPDKTFLTDEVLKKQIEKMPITDVRIVGEDGNTVHVLANFGDQALDEEIPVKQSSDGLFKVEYPTYSLNFGKDKSKGSSAVLESVSIFGTPLPASGIAYLFPGAIEVTSANPYIDLKYRRDAYLLSGTSYKEPEERADFELNVSEEGTKAADKAILDAMTECAKSNSLAPPNCPQGGAYFSRSLLVDGTARWTPPTNTDKVKLRMGAQVLGDGLDGHADVSGAVDFQLSAQGTDPSFSVTNENVRIELRGYVDLTKNPPTYTYEKGY
ncbi:DUF4878 domain-containing protein [Mycolicibacterium boenickei]|nr:DUF4878 domain-containing protein [Mycolicibacterium boenickei]